MEYTAPSWTPISITGLSGSDPNVELCKLDFKEYAKNPHLYAMFKDLVAKSQCSGANSRYARLSELKNEMRNKPTDWTYLQPTGFVFHESRVGSTLVANMLASDPLSMVFSESAPPSAVLLARGLSRERKIELFRDVLTLMGLTTMHQRMFFKFQSITNTVNDIALEVRINEPARMLLCRLLYVLLLGLSEYSLGVCVSPARPDDDVPRGQRESWGSLPEVKEISARGGI